MVNPAFFKATDVSKVYPGKLQSGVKSIDISIQQGKITAIIGESGSGKSTLLRLLFGLLTLDAGLVEFKGERVWGPDEKLIPGHDRMKMVTQHTDDLNLFAKVWDNVAILMPNTNLQAKQEQTEKLLRQLNMLHLAEKRVSELSGGEKQRVAIARALITQPEVLLLDEPFNQVDTTFRDGLQQDIRRVVKETGLTVIIVSHDPAEVLSMADELVVIKSGQVLEMGAPKDVYNHPKNLYTALLLSHSNVLTDDDARRLHINAYEKQVVIYPEWIKPVAEKANGSEWTVEEILFKGAYEEVHVVNAGTRVHFVNFNLGAFEEGSRIAIKVKKYLAY
ncbi:ABC transporter ATP-binding protein [Mucilaginibacter sp. CSA2-8R]|uniref:ABC transporter ATP-binding protein n=1 Tax=Mucilaginibacter sp. CSA2-8R TaxID=3141542 RepID=UPI00315D1DCD